MSVRVRVAAILVLVLALGVGAGLPGATVYVNHVVVAPPGPISLSQIVQISSLASPPAGQALCGSVTVLGHAVQYVPSALYQEQLAAAVGPEAITVGSWSMIAPAGSPAGSYPYLLDRLGDYLVSHGLLGVERTEISVTIDSSSGVPPQDGTPTFQLARRAGTTTQVVFRLAGPGGSVSGTAALMAAASTDASAGVRANTIVRVLFRKGPITIELPGRTLGAASVGESVVVYVQESQKRFTASVIDAKAVRVDLP